MPELPEVEVLRRSLEPFVVGARITGLVVSETRLREPVNVAKLRSASVEHEIECVDRRAKYLLLRLSGGSTLVVHLGMSGRLTLTDPERPQEPHEHLRFPLSTGRMLRFRDPRRFGLVFALETDDLARDRHFAHLGPEPLGDDFSTDYAVSKSRGRRGPVKNFLMDSRIVVGVGNIYACEALYRARVHPSRPAGRISRERWSRLREAVRAVLLKAVEEGGTTLNDFRNANGKEGYFQVSLAVYGRESEPCGSCGSAIRRIVQAGRSTFYCPRCQR